VAKEVPVTTSRSASLLILLTVTLASGRAGAADELMPGKLILVKPGRLAKFIGKPAPGGSFALPAGGSAPTTGGGQLRFFKGNRVDTFALPVQAAPLGWKGLGSPAGSKGFKYRGAGTTADPCKVVLIKTRTVKALCRGGAVKFDPPATGDVGVLLTVGATPMTYLAVFGGDEISNTASQLKRKDAPAPPSCDCGATDPMEFRFANGVGSGICGNVTDGTVTKTFNCSQMVVGGGNSPVPATVFPDMVNPLRLKVAECTGKNLILESMSAAETGSNLQCSEPGCLFAPPLAFVLPITPQSACIYMRVERAGHGTVQCDSGDASVDMQILGAMYLNGDIMPDRCVGGTNPGARCGTFGLNTFVCLGGGVCTPDPDVQPCPICNPTTGRCNGGTNGMGSTGAVDTDSPCTAGSQAAPGPQFPTSHGCPSSPLNFLGDMPLPFDISTGTTIRRAFDSATQPRAFCGFCRNPDTLCFEGDPACPGGTNQLHRCSSDGECQPPFGVCQQRSGGAFGPNGSGFRTATEIGTPAGSLEDFAPHPGTLSGFFCISPTFSAIIDASSDLPGPGANSLPGSLQLSPSGAFVDDPSLP
jgi:hypothetical protein